MTDVVITGIGVVSPFGVGKEKFLSALRKGASVTRSPVPEFKGTTLEALQVGSIPNLTQASQQLPRKLTKFMAVASLIGCLAGKEAANEAAIGERFDLEHVGIFSATGLTAANFDETTEMLRACLNSEGRFSEKLLGKVGLGLMNPLNSFKVLPNMPPCILSILLGIRGPNLIFNPWEDQAAAAIYEAFRAVCEGEVDCALVGAADTPSAASTVLYLKQKELIEEHEFPSSAGAYLVLESRDKAKADGKSSYGELKEVALDNDGEGVRDPLAEKLGRTFAAAPVLLLAAACLGVNKATSMVGTRGAKFTFTFKKDQ